MWPWTVSVLLISFRTLPQKIECLYLTNRRAHLSSHSEHRPFGLRDLEVWATKNTGGHNNVPRAWEQSCTLLRAAVHWCERLSFSGKLRGCTGVIQRLGGELKFGGCYKRMLMFSSASFLSDGDCSFLWVWTHTAVFTVIYSVDPEESNVELNRGRLFMAVININPRKREGKAEG